MLIDNLCSSPDPPPIPLMCLSAHSIQGKRSHMEDFFDMGYQLKQCKNLKNLNWPYEYFYFGIFDGHGGSEAAKFAKENLVKFITQQVDFWSENDDDILKAIQKGFADTHSAMRQEMPKWSRTSRILPSTAGTTASVIFIKNGKFYSGHVGDSRIVISQKNGETYRWISQQLTEDHKPESKQETQRIERAGGEVKSKIGVHRVVWKRPVLNNDLENKLILGTSENSEYDECLEQISTYPVSDLLVESYQTIPFLAIARSLGDFWSLNPYTGQYVVSPEPDVSCRPITENDKAIILATDGLWNVINSSQAVRFLEELYNTKARGDPRYGNYYSSDNFYDLAGPESRNYALSLVYFAYQIWERKRLRSDNITVVVAILNGILPQTTRISPHTGPTGQIVKNGLIQINQTNSFLEELEFDRPPKLYVSDNVDDERLRKLESFLLLPPTLLEQEYHSQQPKIVYPKNYERLSKAHCRRIYLYTEKGEYIHAKRVSDDPDDDVREPTRVSRAGKVVRNSSAQATQSIHDFGQPWDQLLDEEIVEQEEFVIPEDDLIYEPENEVEFGEELAKQMKREREERYATTVSGRKRRAKLHVANLQNC